MRPLFQLDPRLALCASMVSQGAVLADVGTDHGYLPVWLVKAGVISKAFALDVKEGPLSRAKRTVSKYRAENAVELRLSNGLSALKPGEADTAVFAGMGGELIAALLEQAPWVQEYQTKLILQPMTSAENLRLWLLDHRFALLEERPVSSAGKVYSVMRVCYSGKPQTAGTLYPYLGRLPECENSTAEERLAAAAYEQRVLRDLEKRRSGAEAQNREEDRCRYETAIRELNSLMKGEQG